MQKSGQKEDAQSIMFAPNVTTRATQKKQKKYAHVEIVLEVNIPQTAPGIKKPKPKPKPKHRSNQMAH